MNNRFIPGTTMKFSEQARESIMQNNLKFIAEEDLLSFA